MTDSRQTWLIGTVMMVVIAGLAWMVMHRGTADGSAAKDGGPAAARMASMEARQTRQEQEMETRLGRIEQLLEGRAAMPGSSTSSGAAAIAADPDVQARNNEAGVLRDQAAYRQLFASDLRGPDAAGWESRINTAFAAPEVLKARDQPASRDVRCSQHICAIRAVFPAGKESDGWSTGIAMALGAAFTDSRVVVRQLPSGESEMTMYAFRKGAEWMLVDPATGGPR